MKAWQIIVGIAMFCVVTVILYLWGLKKSLNGQADLERRLIGACGARVLKRLKKQEAATKKEIAQWITGITVGPIWSKQKIRVQDGDKLSEPLLKYLCEQQYIEVTEQGAYRLRKKRRG